MARDVGVGCRGAWPRWLVAALSMFVLPAAALAQDDFPFDDFPRTTLARLAAAHAGEAKGESAASSVKGEFAYDIRTPRARVQVTLLGPSEPIPRERMRLIATHLVNVTKRDPASLYARQYLVEEAGKRYWLPVQATLEDDLHKEVAAGGKVDFYLLDIGSVILQGKVDMVLEVEAFEAD